jgi:hypothetical protein
MTFVKRRLFTLAAAVSFILCVAIGVLWVRSEWYTFGMKRYEIRGTPSRLLTDYWVVAGGQFQWSMNDSPTISPQPPSVQFSWYRRPISAGGADAVIRSVSVLGFSFQSMSTSNRVPSHWRAVAFPCWFVAALLGVLPAAFARSRLRERKQNAVGRCRKCGYDLRATPGRCPECGMEANPAASGEPIT